MRSLSPSERKKVLDKLHLLTDAELSYSGEIRKLQSTDLYSYPAGYLRIILSKSDAGWVVEDIIDHDKYRRLELETRPVEKV